MGLREGFATYAASWLADKGSCRTPRYLGFSRASCSDISQGLCPADR